MCSETEPKSGYCQMRMKDVDIRETSVAKLKREDFCVNPLKCELLGVKCRGHVMSCKV